MIYGAFLRHSHSKLWSVGRECALVHCHGFMTKFIALADGPGFQSFHWAWPGTHQPMHATMILLVDVYERPYSPEAPASRAYIDKIFSMSGPDGGIVSGPNGQSAQRPLREGGREAWDLLRRLRDKAWQKAGLDPAYFWTLDQQVSAGVGQPLGQPEQHVQAVREGSTQPLHEPVQSLSTSTEQSYEPSTGAISSTSPTQVTPEDEEMAKRRRIPAQQMSSTTSQSTGPGSGTTWSNDSSISPSEKLGLESNDLNGDDLVNSHFDWEAWDSVFGQHPDIDEMVWNV